MAEWSKAAASKAAILCKWNRGFESLSLLQSTFIRGFRLGKLRLAQPVFLNEIFILKERLSGKALAKTDSLGHALMLQKSFIKLIYKWHLRILRGISK